MRMSKLVVALFCLFLFAAAARASINGRISGIVTDPNGGVIWPWSQ